MVSASVWIIYQYQFLHWQGHTDFALILYLANKHTSNTPDCNFNWQALLINCFTASGYQGLQCEQ